jgi:hypothetical protein
MAISWIKTIDIINQLGLKHETISKETGLSNEVLAKFKNSGHMSTRSVEILASYFSKKSGKQLQPSDLFEFR